MFMGIYADNKLFTVLFTAASRKGERGGHGELSSSKKPPGSHEHRPSPHHFRHLLDEDAGPEAGWHLTFGGRPSAGEHTTH